VVGALIAWVIGRTGGRAFVDRYGKYILLSHRDLDRAEAWYGRHDRWGVFGSRSFRSSVTSWPCRPVWPKCPSSVSAY